MSDVILAIIIVLIILYILLFRVGFISLFLNAKKQKNNYTISEREYKKEMRNIENLREQTINQAKQRYYTRIHSGIQPKYEYHLETYLRRFFNAVKVTNSNGYGNVTIQRVGNQVSLYGIFHSNNSCFDALAYDGILDYDEFRALGTYNEIFESRVPQITYEEWEGSFQSIILARMQEPLPYATYSFSESNAQQAIVQFNV